MAGGGHAVIRKMGIEWHLRLRMAERGIDLSREQVFRLVAQPPQRLSMDTLAALCDILDCQPDDLIEVKKVNAEARKAAGDTKRAAPQVRRTTIRRPEGL